MYERARPSPNERRIYTMAVTHRAEDKESPMPHIPSMPRKRNPARPPRRRGAGEAEGESARPRRRPHSYGQSAPMPQPTDAEELAAEPMREEGEDKAG